MVSWHVRLATLAAAVALTGCGPGKQEAPPSQSAATPAPAAKPTPATTPTPDASVPASPAAASPAPEGDNKPAAKKPTEASAPDHEALRDPSRAGATAPANFKVRFHTTKGDFVVEVTRRWAPKGADRLFNLVKIGYFTDVAFFRVIEGFMVQFGIHGDPEISRAWERAQISDDAVTQSNTRGAVTFATAGPNTRTTQLFINFGNNARLDGTGFSPIGRVVQGMEVVDSLYNGYGEGAPRGRGPSQGRMESEGNKYLKKDFPKLDYIRTASRVK